MNREEMEEICKLVKVEMQQAVGNKIIDLSLKQKVVLCLKMLGSGSFQSTSRDFRKATIQLRVILSYKQSDFVTNDHMTDSILNIEKME